MPVASPRQALFSLRSSALRVKKLRWDRQMAGFLARALRICNRLADNTPDKVMALPSPMRRQMATQRFLLKAAAALAATLLQTPPAPLRAQAQTPSVLTGQVTSAEEGPMEGVVITARK